MSVTDFSKPTPMIVDFLSDIRPGDALDIGAGYGRNSLYLAGNGWNVDALDTDLRALEHLDQIARKKSLALRTIPQDFTLYDTPKEYDAIISLMTLHFMNRQDITSAIGWIMEHTKPGGIVAISGFNDKNEAGTRPYLFGTDELAVFFAEWTIVYNEGSGSSSMIDEKTQQIDTFYVSRIVARKPY